MTFQDYKFIFLSYMHSLFFSLTSYSKSFRLMDRLSQKLFTAFRCLTDSAFLFYFYLSYSYKDEKNFSSTVSSLSIFFYIEKSFISIKRFFLLLRNFFEFSFIFLNNDKFRTSPFCSKTYIHKQSLFNFA